MAKKTIEPHPSAVLFRAAEALCNALNVLLRQQGCDRGVAVYVSSHDKKVKLVVGKLD